MKKKLILLLLLVPLFSFGYDSVADCDKAIKALTVERSRLRNLEKVVFADKDDKRSNIVRKMDVIYLNRVFVPSRQGRFSDYKALCVKACEYKNAQSRMVEIDSELEQIKLERAKLLDEKRTRRAKSK